MHVRAASPPAFRRRWRACAAVVGVACSVGVHGPAHAEDLHGTVRLIERGAPAADVGEALVWWVPESGVHAAPPRHVEINTERRQFSPRTLVVSPGSTARFPNADPIRHNVFSVSAANRFDLGLYGRGPGRSQTFKQPGLVRIFCNVHRQMAAWVLVLETPFHTTVAADGSFSLNGLPVGAGTLHAWHPRAAEWSRALESPAAPLVIELDAAHSAVPDHLNKFGRPYPETPDDGPYR
jgi:plastocyanin